MTEQQAPERVKLLPCPFCGGEDVYTSSTGSNRDMGREYYAVTCALCGAVGSDTLEPESPAASWNTRATPPSDQSATIARLTSDVADWKARYFKTRDERDKAQIASANYANFSHEWRQRAEKAEAKLAEATAERERLQAAIKRQAGAAKTLREATLAEVQHLRDVDRREYVAHKTLDSEREANAKLTEEVDRLTEQVNILTTEKHADAEAIGALEAKLAEVTAAGTFAQGIEAALAVVTEEARRQLWHARHVGNDTKTRERASSAWSALDIAAQTIRALAPQPEADLVTCPGCEGTGIAGHPDSGYTCTKCSGCGGVQPEADPVREARPPDVVVGADSTKLIAGFMLDCNAVGVEGAAQNLVKSIKERCAAYRALAGGQQ